ncbi:hypothetical protein INR49_010725 [Caranx melampygus]|nr:hypothetical protein INR49_010725 [Caranx melampygus]
MQQIVEPKSIHDALHQFQSDFSSTLKRSTRMSNKGPRPCLSWVTWEFRRGRGSEVLGVWAARPPLLFWKVQADLGVAGAVTLAGDPVPDGEVLRAAFGLQPVHG